MNEGEIWPSTPDRPRSDGAEPHKAWVRYRTEIYERETGDVLRYFDSREPKSLELQRSDNDPVFEVVTRYGARESNSGPGKRETPTPMASPVVGSAASHLLRIYSPAIINALQSVVRYYPSQDLSGTRLEIDWPYPVLVHHYAELHEFKIACVNKVPTELCVREHDASEHIGLLLRFLEDNIMDRVRAEEERLRRGYYTFENLWVSHKPGRTVAVRHSEEGTWWPSVIYEVSGGIFTRPPQAWKITSWRLEFNGRVLGRVSTTTLRSTFDGEAAFHGRTDFVDDIDKSDNDQLSKLIIDGQRYCELVKKQCQYHSGKTVNFPYNEIEGLVMADLESYYAVNVTSRPSLMSDDDCRRWTSDCSCDVCKQRELRGERSVASAFRGYNFVVVERFRDLTRHKFLLCPSHIPAFVFKLRKWEKLHVANLKQPVFQNNMIDSLVMDSSRVRALKALASSYIRINQHGNPIEHEVWAADFVKGKGSGLIFLLHGKPGVGKTATAESIAEFTQRPLMSLTSSDIGTDPELVEENLTRDFKTARSWGAVLLIDEADVFMERRSSHDLERNGLVAGFLRALEFYDGILFLTTNRVGAFDDAFISRIHIQLYYPDFTDEERQEVWMAFVRKLNKERGKYIRLTLNAEDYIKGQELRSVKWNGREIRNAFQTAVSLAEYEDDRDDEGKILLTHQHLRSVVTLSKDFKAYLDELHKADEDKRAQRRFDR